MPKIPEVFSNMLFKYQLVYVVAFIGIFLASFFILTWLENKKRIKNPPLRKTPFVSVIIPAFNEQKSIRKTIESLQKLNYPHFDIIVVDDGSTDKTYKIAKEMAKLDPRVKVYTKKNGGKASAINYALKRTKSEYVATLDADSFVTPNALRNMMGYFGDSRVVSVTPSLRVYNTKGFLARIQHVEYLFGIFYRKVFSLVNVLHVTPGPFSVYKSIFFKKHGGFDEDNPTEDTEIALRIQSLDYRIENSIDAIVYTIVPTGLWDLIDQRKRWYYGLIKNLENYPQLFKPRYGYLGMIALPAALISIVLIFAVIGYFSYIAITNFVQAMINFHLIGYDLVTLLQEFEFKYIYYEVTNPIVFFLGFLILLNLIFVLVAKAKASDKGNIKLSYLYYMGFYGYFYAFWWLMAIFTRLFGKIKWKGRKYK